MNAPTKQNPIPKVIALILASIWAASLQKSFDASALARLDSMSAGAVVQQQRELHQHSFVFHFIVILILGCLFLGLVELIAYAIGLAFGKKADAFHKGSFSGKG